MASGLCVTIWDATMKWSSPSRRRAHVRRDSGALTISPLGSGGVSGASLFAYEL